MPFKDGKPVDRRAAFEIQCLERAIEDERCDDAVRLSISSAKRMSGTRRTKRLGCAIEGSLLRAAAEIGVGELVDREESTGLVVYVKSHKTLYKWQQQMMSWFAGLSSTKTKGSCCKVG